MAKKPKVKVGLKGKSLQQKIDQANNIVTLSTGKASLPGVQPRLAGLAAKATAAATKLAKQTQKQQEAVTATSEANDAEVALDAELTACGQLVDIDAAGNATVILESGFSVASSPAPAGPMPQVQNLGATRVTPTPKRT